MMNRNTKKTNRREGGGIALKALLLSILSIIGFSSLSATSLKQVVGEVLDTNPTVVERLKNYHAIREEIGIAEAGYYPKVDLQSGVGKKHVGRLSGDVAENIAHQTYTIFQNSLVLRQNIFNGYSTRENVNYQKMKTLSAAYSYLESANDVTLKAIRVYLNLHRQQELLANSQENVKHIKQIYSEISKAYKSGLTPLSEVSKIQSSLWQAKSNVLVRQNKLSNAMFNFRRVTGYLVSLKDLKKVNFMLRLPENLRKATMFALEYNPSLMSGKYNIKGAEALYRESKSKYYPTLDLQVSENYNKNTDDFIGIDDRFQAMLMLNYNIFNGGADEAARRSKLSRVSQEVAVVDDIRRQVIEGMDLSWGAYELSINQIPVLRNYQRQSAKTLRLYVKEFVMGERSLLDLLAAENDLVRANAEQINANYDLLLSKYRILDAMGLTMASIMGNVKKYYKRVGIHNKGKRTSRDSLPASYDKDRDGVPANKDLCRRTKKNHGVLPFGCTKSVKALKTIRL